MAGTSISNADHVRFEPTTTCLHIDNIPKVNENNNYSNKKNNHK